VTADPVTDLARRLAPVVGADQIRDLDQLSGGASRETWSFLAVDPGGRQRSLILQRQRPGTVCDISQQASLLKVARRGGVPVAEVVTASSDWDDLGAPYIVVTNVPGETIARKILRDEAYASARRTLPAQLGQALAMLHAIPVDAVPGLEAPDQVALYRDALDTLGQPHPAFEIGFRWLDANRPAMNPPAIVHGDFRLGNVVVDHDGLAAVLDWELAHVGDPMEDLGWLCVRAWRFGASLPVAGLGRYAELFDAYRGAGGREVEPAVVRWWEVLGTLKWGIMCVMQADAHLSGRSRSHELAAIGRRVCENEHDLLLLLDRS
jgi:aminoglycoside phosphotransferase (APT) family kinase protein